MRFSKFHVIRMYDCFHTRLLCIERKGSKKPRDPCPKSLQTQLSSPWMRKACESLQDWIRAKQPSSSSLTSSSVYSFTLRMQSINNKDLPYSTGNYIQYPTMNHNGKEYEKEYIYIKLNHFAVHLKLIQHCKTILQKKAVLFWKKYIYITDIHIFSEIEGRSQMLQAVWYAHSVICGKVHSHGSEPKMCRPARQALRGQQWAWGGHPQQENR